MHQNYFSLLILHFLTGVLKYFQLETGVGGAGAKTHPVDPELVFDQFPVSSATVIHQSPH